MTTPDPPEDGSRAPATRPDLAKRPTDGSRGPATRPDLAKRPLRPPAPHPAPAQHAAAERPPGPVGPAWLVVPIRLIALIVIVPFRLLYDLLVVCGRGIRAGWRALGRVPAAVGRVLGAIGRALYAGLLAPIGRVLAAAGRGVATLLGRLGSGAALLFTLLLIRPAAWVAATLLAPVGRLVAAVAAAIAAAVLGTLRLAGRVLDLLLIRPLRALGRGIAVVFGAIGAGLAWLATRTGRLVLLIVKGVATGIAAVFAVAVVLPLVLLWRYVLRPPLAAGAWLARHAAHAAAVVATALGGALVWAWRLIGRGLAALCRVLFVLPALAVWRYAMAPTGRAGAALWRLAARVVRRLWRALVVTPVRWSRRVAARAGHVLIVVPARRVRSAILHPVRTGFVHAWRRAVGEPARAVRQSLAAAGQGVRTSMRDAGRDVRLQLRRTFRGR